MDELARTFGPTKTYGCTAVAHVVAVMLGIALAVSAASAANPKHEIAPLKAEADRVWQINERGDMVDAAKEVALIVRAADKMYETGQLEDAREYYRRASVVSPWNFDVKLRYAEMLQRLDDAEGARAVARLVLKYAETDRQLMAARGIAGVAAPESLPALKDIQPAAGEVVLGLVATPETDRWLLDAVGKRLATTLGVRVGIAATDFDVGEHARSGRAQIAFELRKTLPWEDPRLLMSAPSGHRVRQEDLTDDQVIQAMEMFVKRDGMPGQYESFKQRLDAADKVSQWDVTQLLGRLRAVQAQPAQGRVVYLALVPQDLFAGRVNYLYGSADVVGNYAVISYHRFAASVTGEPAQSARLVARTLKQMLSSTGFALGVGRCSDPGCARAYPRSLLEHDAKGTSLCEECRAELAKVLGHEPPAAREE